jgi:hypothetical protein
MTSYPRRKTCGHSAKASHASRVARTAARALSWLCARCGLHSRPATKPDCFALESLLARRRIGMGELPLARKSIRQRALAGETVLGAMIFEFFVPGMPQLLRNAGAEFAIYDMEHGGSASRPSRCSRLQVAGRAWCQWCAYRAENTTLSPVRLTSVRKV